MITMFSFFFPMSFFLIRSIACLLLIINSSNVISELHLPFIIGRQPCFCVTNLYCRGEKEEKYFSLLLEQLAPFDPKVMRILPIYNVSDSMRSLCH